VWFVVGARIVVLINELRSVFFGANIVFFFDVIGRGGLGESDATALLLVSSKSIYTGGSTTGAYLDTSIRRKLVLPVMVLAVRLSDVFKESLERSAADRTVSRS
jgi:hypothetical protein